MACEIQISVGRLTPVGISTGFGFQLEHSGTLLLLLTQRAQAAFAVEGRICGGRTAKATAALGTLPYAGVMQPFTTRLRF